MGKINWNTMTKKKKSAAAMPAESPDTVSAQEPEQNPDPAETAKPKVKVVIPQAIPESPAETERPREYGAPGLLLFDAMAAWILMAGASAGDCFRKAAAWVLGKFRRGRK